MAKKITILGENLLSSLSDPWGGVNTGSTAITPYSDKGAETEVPPGAEWGMNRGEVERFIKSQFSVNTSALASISSALLSKVGYIARVDGANDDDPSMLVAFANQSDYEAWMLDNDDPNHQPLVSFELPTGGGGTSAYTLSLEGTTPDAVQMTSDFAVRLRAGS